MDPAVFGHLAAAIPDVTVVRDLIFWHEVDPAGTGDFALTTEHEDYLDALATAGQSLLLTLLWGNAGAGYTLALPDSEAERTAFCDYASWVIGQVEARGVTLYGVEFWNEAAGKWPGLPADPDATYEELTSDERDTLADLHVDLLQALRARLTSDHPDVLLGAGADLEVEIDWFNRLIPLGFLDYCDAVVVHPYGDSDVTLPTLRAAMAAVGHKAKPLWATEYGFGGAAPAISQASAWRTGALSIAEGANLLSWYLAEPFSLRIEALLTEDGVLDDEGVAYGYLASTLAGATYVSSLSAPTGVDAERFITTGKSELVVIWALAGATVTITGASEIRDVTGAIVPLTSSYVLTDSPLIAVGGAIGVALAA